MNKSECPHYSELVHTVSSAMQEKRYGPPHVHIERDQDEAKFWLSPVRLQNNRGFSRTEINHIQKLVEEHQEQLLAGWHDFFNG